MGSWWSFWNWKWPRALWWNIIIIIIKLCWHWAFQLNSATIGLAKVIPCDLRRESESSDEAGSSSSYLESDPGDDSEGFGEVNLCYERIFSLHRKGLTKPSTYAKTGGSAKRVRRVLNNPICSCACKLPYKILLRLCVAFWNLWKTDQDRLIWALQHESGKRKLRWFLQGSGLPKKCYVYLCLVGWSKWWVS